MAVPGGLKALADAVCDAVDALEPGPLVVALSGGADSAVAAWACARVRPTAQRRVRGCHVVSIESVAPRQAPRCFSKWMAPLVAPLMGRRRDAVIDPPR